MEMENVAPYQYCPICFRSYPLESKYWLKCPTDIIVKIVNEEWYNEDYKNLILNIILQHEVHCEKQRDAEKDSIGICTDCNIFFQKKEVCLETNGSRKKNFASSLNCKHSMCVFVEYVLSGGLSVKPCNSFIFQATQSLLKNFPENPLLQIENGTFSALMGSISTFCNVTGFTSCDLPEFICVLKWIFCGASSLILDPNFAKKMRHYFRKHEGHDEWWKTKIFSFCRFCSPNPIHKIYSEKVLSTCTERLPFDLVLVSGKSNIQDHVKWLLGEMENTEKHQICMDYTCSFCVRCCKYSILHHNHENVLQNIFQRDKETKKELCNSNVSVLRYYTLKVIYFKKKKTEMSQRKLQKRKCRNPRSLFFE
jgi:hypothetical protein